MNDAGPAPIESLFHQFSGVHVLLLQGPMGPFFRQVAQLLYDEGARVSKVNFNAADAVYFASAARTHFYRGTFEHWPTYLSRVITDDSVNAIMLFGDCRPYHRAAIACAERLRIEVYVFEEGYLRPDFVTLERDGVNGNSRLSHDPDFYRAIDVHPLPVPLPVRHAYLHAVIHSTAYSILATALSWLSPNYRHHRDINCFRQSVVWLRGAARRVVRTIRDRRIRKVMSEGRLGPYFLVPLQVHLDSQISHSAFDDVSDFIECVTKSFANHAPKDCCLVLKDHPLGRPYRDYSRLVRRLRRELGLDRRLLHVDVVNLPSALGHARGTVVLNSTVGLSSICHHTPTKCLGKAVYDIEGLTYQGPLDEFWHEPGVIDNGLLRNFCYWLRKTTQLNGSIWTGFTS